MFRPLLISLCLTSTALATTWTVDDDDCLTVESVAPVAFATILIEAFATI